LGTSLPELVTSIVAALHGHPAVAIRNVVGSNLFNFLGVSGVIGLISIVSVPGQIVFFDVWVMLGATAVLFLVLVMSWRIPRSTGLLLLITFIGYVFVQTYGVKNTMVFFG
jgi:cation:H+ antiporter